MDRHDRTGEAVPRRRDGRRARLLGAATRWAGRADRCAGWTGRGVERCRRWAREGARRPGELAPPSWFAIALPFGIAWYRVLGAAARTWCRVARQACRLFARAFPRSVPADRERGERDVS
ncbi:hypothetical protein ACFVHB_14550 [Kitasatospora sp. NPDC127111]|uniref:hypothetical protein n=1 Tax=Kitasatospora sp. NPDC127111 TaxID=3345363 RepID=UPI0036447C09